MIELHPDADGKPCVIGNCQAGWAVMMLAAIAPELFGPIIVAGSPLSYWTGQRGLNPMRYTGGLLGGSWLTAFTGDLGHGRFDGAWLVQNFENLNPANTLWTKQYNLYSKIDTEAPRYLEFERWWGGHVNLNAEEMQFIVDELFVGNKLAAGEVKTSDGTAIDLRNIRSPIVVFCSKGDNITPPQQALGWILDLYDDVDEIRSYGQTIVYTIHESVGHLGIFVSGGVARKEHGEFASNIDLIDVLPPGLYEAVFEAKSGRHRRMPISRTANGSCAARRARSTTSARSAATTPPTSAGLRRRPGCRRPISRSTGRSRSRSCARWSARRWPTGCSACIRCGCNTSCSPTPIRSWRCWRPWPAGCASIASPSSADNPFLAAQESFSRQIVAGARRLARLREASPSRCSSRSTARPRCRPRSASIRPRTEPLRKARKSALHRELVQRRIAELKSRIANGGLREAVVRALHLCRHAARGGRRARVRDDPPDPRAQEDMPALPLAEFKALVREQFFMLLIDPEAADRRPCRRCCRRIRTSRRKALGRHPRSARGARPAERRGRSAHAADRRIFAVRRRRRGRCGLAS